MRTIVRFDGGNWSSSCDAALDNATSLECRLHAVIEHFGRSASRTCEGRFDLPLDACPKPTPAGDKPFHFEAFRPVTETMNKCADVWTMAAICSFALLLPLGCDDSSQKGDEEQTDEQQASKEMPSEVVFAFQPQENPEGLAPDADRLAEYMTERIGVQADVFLPTSYAAVVEALRSGNADVAYFSGWPYLIANRKADVELLVVEERNGNPYYRSRWYVDDSSDIESLTDLEGKAVSFTSPTSTSGYLFPTAKVIEETSMETGDDPKSFFSEVVYAGGYQQSLQALLHDRVDAAAASDYAFELYLDEKERKGVRVLSTQGPVPTHGVGVRSTLPDELKSKIRDAFLELNDSEHNELLKSLYGAERLVERSHEEHVSALEEALETVGEESDIEGFGAGSGSGSGHGAAKGSGEDEGSAEGSAQGSAKGSGKGAGSGSGHGSEEAGPGAGAGSHAGSGRGE